MKKTVSGITWDRSDGFSWAKTIDRLPERCTEVEISWEVPDEHETALEDRVTALEKEIAELKARPTWIYYPQPYYYPYYHPNPVWTAGYYTTSGGSDAESSA